MCRHVAYLGPPVPLRELLVDPPHSLLRQSWAPRRQLHGRMNADGFGVGWYAEGDPIPAHFIKDVALFIAAPFIGLMYAALFPFIGLGMLAWMGVRALTKRRAVA